MARRLADSVVVITGASSGIGRAAALGFARRGAIVVLAARREQAIQEVAEECRAEAGDALAVPTDVSDEAAVEALARRAVEGYGRVDVWVNNAGVTLFGRFDETPMDVYRRVIDTNLFGYIHGARAALPYFREQGTGVLINNASVAGVVGQPYTSAYCISKFAIRGLGECLRQELVGERIHVSTILPASIDTPLFHNAANYTGRAVKPLEPVYDAEQVAEAIVWAAKYPVRELIVGNAGRLLSAVHTLSPALAERIVARQVEADHFQDRAQDPTPGNLFEPSREWASIDGDWAPRRQRRLALQRLRPGPAALLTALAAGVVVAGLRR